METFEHTVSRSSPRQENDANVFQRKGCRVEERWQRVAQLFSLRCFPVLDARVALTHSKRIRCLCACQFPGGKTSFERNRKVTRNHVTLRISQEAVTHWRVTRIAASRAKTSATEKYHMQLPR